MFNITITPKLLKKVEQALERLNTPAQKRKWEKRTASFRGNTFMWINGVGWVLF